MSIAYVKENNAFKQRWYALMKPEEIQVEAKSFITYRNYKRRLTIKQIQKELLSIGMLLHIKGQNMR